MYRDHKIRNLIRVLAGDPRSNDVSLRQRLIAWSDEVDDALSPRLFTIQHADVFDTMQRYTHRYLYSQCYRYVKCETTASRSDLHCSVNSTYIFNIRSDIRRDSDMTNRLSRTARLYKWH